MLIMLVVLCLIGVLVTLFMSTVIGSLVEMALFGLVPRAVFEMSTGSTIGLVVGIIFCVFIVYEAVVEGRRK